MLPAIVPKSEAVVTKEQASAIRGIAGQVGQCFSNVSVATDPIRGSFYTIDECVELPVAGLVIGFLHGVRGCVTASPDAVTCVT